MLSGRTIYVLGLLQIGILLILMAGSPTFMGCSAKQEVAVYSLPYNMRSSIEQIIARIVKITAQRDGEQRIGTGIVVRLSQDEAYIVIAADVVGTASRAEVVFFDRRNRPVSASLVRLKAQDPSELAFLRVTGKENVPVGLPPLPLQSSTYLVTYLLLEIPALTSQAPKEPAAWILENYHYTCARVLLSAVPGTHRERPYLVSSLKPLSGLELISEPYLYQDLSSVPSRLIQLWVKEFLNQAAQERLEGERTIPQWVLKLRTAMAVLAEGLPEVREAFAEWGKGSSSLQEGINQRIGGKP